MVRHQLQIQCFPQRRFCQSHWVTRRSQVRSLQDVHICTTATCHGKNCLHTHFQGPGFHHLPKTEKCRWVFFISKSHYWKLCQVWSQRLSWTPGFIHYFTSCSNPLGLWPCSMLVFSSLLPFTLLIQYELLVCRGIAVLFRPRWTISTHLRPLHMWSALCLLHVKTVKLRLEILTGWNLHFCYLIFFSLEDRAKCRGR